MTVSRPHVSPDGVDDPVRRFAYVVILALLYVGAGRVGHAFAMLGSTVTPVWIPSGIALAALLLFGRSLWPGVWLGALAIDLAGLVRHDGMLSLANFLTACGMATGALLAALLAHGALETRVAAGTLLNRVGTIPLLLIGGVVGGLCSATLGVLSLSLSGSLPWAAFFEVWQTWWVGDAMGVCIATPLLLAWCESMGYRPRVNVFECAFSYTLLAGLSWFAFMWEGSGIELGRVIPFMLVPLLAWPALRFGHRGGTAAVALVAALAVIGTSQGRGPFHLESLNSSLVELEVFLCMVAVTSLMAAAVMTEHQAAHDDQRRVLNELEDRVASRTAALAESENKLRAIVESEPECVSLIGADGKLLAMNPAGLAMVDAPSFEELSRHSLAELIAPEYLQAVDAANRRVLAGERVMLEYEIVGLKGNRRWVERNSVPLRDAEGGNVSILSVTRDLTDRRKAEAEHREMEYRLRQAQKLEAIGTLAGGIAHDFNNLLAIILGNGQLLESELAGQETAQEYLRDIRNAGERGKSLVGKILSFSRMSQSETASTDLRDTVEEVAKSLRNSVPQAVAMTVHPAEDVPAVQIDPTELYQVFLNLLMNSVQAIGNREGAIDVYLERRLVEPGRMAVSEGVPPGLYAQVRIRDSGEGIDPNVRDRIFEPFFTTKGVGSGTGLGLSLVHGIVKRARGSISVMSAPGQGTTVRFLLPAFILAVEESATSRFAGTAPRPGSGKHVLILDDEAALVDLLYRSLSRLGYRVTGSTDPEQALAVFSDRPDDIDLLVTDFNMPGINGIEVTRRIRQQRAGLPVLLVTGYLDDSLRNEAQRAGIDQVLDKPNTIEEMAQAVHRLLEREAVA
ncbi:MAG: hypothetical protein RLZZ200_942 [Pseudomonadota bacterium]